MNQDGVTSPPGVLWWVLFLYSKFWNPYVKNHHIALLIFGAEQLCAGNFKYKNMPRCLPQAILLGARAPLHHSLAVPSTVLDVLFSQMSRSFYILSPNLGLIWLEWTHLSSAKAKAPSQQRWDWLSQDRQFCHCGLTAYLFSYCRRLPEPNQNSSFLPPDSSTNL
jgi:hypothetical protein